MAWIMHVMQFKGNMHDANFFIVPFERIKKEVCKLLFYIQCKQIIYDT